MIYPVFWKERRIPTWIALLVLGIGITVGVTSIQKTQTPYLRANPDITPEQVRVTNLRADSFTVSWITSETTTGFVKYGENSQTELIARDTRDPLVGNFGKHTTHWVTVSGLKNDNTYTFEIFSNNKKFNNNGSPYTVTTAPALSGDEDNNLLIFGKVITEDNQPAIGSIIYLRAVDLSPQSALVRKTGEWTIDMSLARNSKLTEIFTYPSDQFFDTFIQGGNLLRSSQTDTQVKTDFQTSTVAFLASNSTPVPQVILGKDYDFRSISPETSTEPSAKEDSLQAHFDLTPPLIAQQIIDSDGVVVWNPTPEETFENPQPLFIGSAPVNTDLKIQITGTDTITDTAKTDERGYWEWRPSVSLKQGNYTFVAFYTKANNQKYDTSVNFTILLSNQESVISPSPSIVYEISPSPTLTSVPTLTPSISPTETLKTTPTITPIPTLPVVGNALPTLGITGIGLILVGMGVLLVL